MPNQPVEREPECKIVCRRDLERLMLPLGPAELAKFNCAVSWQQAVILFTSSMPAILSGALATLLLLSIFPARSDWAVSAAIGIGILCFVAVLAIAAGIIGSMQSSYPRALILTKDGFKLDWSDGEWTKSSLFPWKAVASVDYDTKDYLTLPSQSITLSLYANQLSLSTLMHYVFAAAPFWHGLPTPRRCNFRIQLEAIPAERDREKLINAIRQHVDMSKCQPEFLKISGGVLPPSHTDIWLEKMSDHMNTSLLEAGAMLSGDAYKIESKLASGGQGTVYLAHATELCEVVNLKAGDKVAIKEFILPLDGGFNARQRALNHVQAEAELLSKINHPHIVKLHDWFVTERRAFLVVQYVEGQSLRAVVEDEGPLRPERVHELITQMCDILEHLHSLDPQVVHRDFTPENLMLAPEGKITLIDFNVAQQLEGNAGRTVVGKHAYIPPEQFKGRATTQSDIYAMGASIFFLLTGEDPEPISASRPSEILADINQAMDELVFKLTQPNLDQRPHSIAEIRNLSKSYGTASHS